MMQRRYDIFSSQALCQAVYRAPTRTAHRPAGVMRAIGMRYVRTFHEQFEDPLPGTELGEVEYDMTREMWLERTSLS